jgi:hypothetical protein
VSGVDGRGGGLVDGVANGRGFGGSRRRRSVHAVSGRLDRRGDGSVLRVSSGLDDGRRGSISTSGLGSLGLVTRLGGIRSNEGRRSSRPSGLSALRHSDGVGHGLSTFGDGDDLGAVTGSRSNGSSSRVLASDRDSDSDWGRAGGRNGNVGVAGHAGSRYDRSRCRRRLCRLLGNGSNWCTGRVDGYRLVAGRRRRSGSWARLVTASVDGGGEGLSDVAGSQVGGVDRAVSALANWSAARNPSVGGLCDRGSHIYRGLRRRRCRGGRG